MSKPNLDEKNYPAIIINRMYIHLNGCLKVYRSSNMQYLAVFGIFFAFNVIELTVLSKLYSIWTIVSLVLAIIGEQRLAKHPTGNIKDTIKKYSESSLFLTIDVVNIFACLVLGILDIFFTNLITENYLWISFFSILLALFIFSIYEVILIKKENVFKKFDISVLNKIVEKLNNYNWAANNWVITDNQLEEFIVECACSKNENGKNRNKKRVCKDIINLISRIDIIEKVKESNGNSGYIYQLTE